MKLIFSVFLLHESAVEIVASVGRTAIALRKYVQLRESFWLPL